MTIDEEFFEWIYQYINGKGRRKLLWALFNEDFFTIMDMDDNRLRDGIELRYRFSDEANIPIRVIDKKLDVDTCSVLEMMVALAIRMEDSVLGDPDYGDRTNMWFWTMVKTLGLYDMTDDNIDYEYVKHTIARFINRDFDRDGNGGLFTVRNTRQDFRDIEIWQQMCLFSDSIML